MKNIKLIKKNIYFAMFVVVLLFFVGFVIAAYSPSEASHEILYTDKIEPKIGPNIVVNPIGRVGIGKTPAYYLDVAGDINLDGVLYQGGAPLVTGYWDGNKPGDIYYDQGNVGIGMSSPPTARLDVAGDIKSNGKLVCLADGTNCPEAGKWDGTKPGDIYYNEGNVGIGVTNPGRRLVIKETDAAIDNVLEVDSGDTTNIKFSAVDFLHNGVMEWGMGKDTNNNFYIDHSSGNRFFIEASSGDVGISGKVGVGTASPGAKLDVTGLSTEGILFQIYDNSGLAGAGEDVFTIQNSNYAYPGLEIYSTGVISQNDPVTGNPVNVLNNGGNSYITGGDVGIGTTGPNEKLTVDGVMGLKEQTTSPTTSSGYGKIYAKEANGVDSYTKLLLHFDRDFLDSSSYWHFPAIAADAKTTLAERVFRASAYFDGSQDNVNYPDSADWNFGNGPLTIEFRIRWDGAPGQTGILGQSTGGGPVTKWALFWNNVDLGLGPNKFTLHVFDNLVTRRDISWDWIPSANTWYHIALVRDDSNNWYFFVDSNQIGSTQNLAFTFADVSKVLRIGHDGEMSKSFKGYIDELRISKGVARWTSNFDIPSSPYHGKALFYKDSDGTEIELT